MKDKELEGQLARLYECGVHGLGDYYPKEAIRGIIGNLIAQERRKAYDQGYADGYLSWENKKNEEARQDAIALNRAIKNLAELKEDKE